MTEFSQRLNDILNSGALNLAIGIGYQLQIFDILEDQPGPATLQEISTASGLNARYLDEWLGIMVTGGIVELTLRADRQGLYSLPDEHAAVLTRKSGNTNMGVYTQEIPMLTACAMKSVVSGFKTGDGIPFSAYPDFQNFMAELSDAKHETILIDHFLPSIDNGKLVGRLNRGISVCDLGCGQGVAAILMARTFPKSSFTGIDNHTEAIKEAKSAAERQGLSNIKFMRLDATTLLHDEEFSGGFDYICAFDAIHDQSHPLEALKAIKYMLAPAGLFSMVDIKASSHHINNLDHPMGPFLYTVSLMHCLPVGLNDQGAGLGMMWGQEKAQSLLQKAGFMQIDLIDMEYDSFNLHYLCR